MAVILIIEDDKSTRENLQELLELSNHEVISAADGKAGIQAATESLPDLILCDGHIPGLDGFQVLSFLKKKPETKVIPFILLSGSEHEPAFRKAMNLGAADCLAKPYNSGELLNAVELRLNTTKRNRVPGKDEWKGQWDDLLAEARQVKYRKREWIFRAGDFPRHLYVIETGMVKEYSITDDNKEYIANIWGKGDVFGYLAAVQGEHYQLFAQALRETVISRIPTTDFQQALLHDHAFALKWLEKVSAEGRENLHHMEQLAYDSVPKRVAFTLLELMESEQKTSFSLSRKTLAHYVGTTKESLVRTLSQFKESGLIDTDGSEISLENPSKLAEDAQNW